MVCGAGEILDEVVPITRYEIGQHVVRSARRRDDWMHLRSRKKAREDDDEHDRNPERRFERAEPNQLWRVGDGGASTRLALTLDPESNA
jgi:hypothetical protein